MKHLIVVAHPAENSFTMALAHAYAYELERLEHDQKTYDLYRMAFDPVLTRDELLPDATALCLPSSDRCRMIFSPLRS